MQEKSAIDFAADMIRVPLECSCGETWRIKATDAKPGLRTICPRCRKVDHLDETTATRIKQQFDELLAQIVDQLNVTQDDKVKSKSRSSSKAKRRIPKGYPVGLVGESFYQTAIVRCKLDDPIQLLREPSNPHDPRAIVAVSKTGETIGYIPRESFLHRLIHDERGGCSSHIFSLNTGDGGITGVVIDVVIDDTLIGEREFLANGASS